MPNMLMLHYAAQHGDDRMDRGDRGMRRSEGGDMRGDYERRNAYEHPGMAYGENRSPDMRQPNQYTRSENEGAESRYRGKDGRWRSGTRRSAYGGSAMDERWSEDRYGDSHPQNRDYDRHKSGGDDDDEEEYKVKVKPSSNIVEWPYANPDDRGGNYRSGRQIGFGAQNNMSEGSDPRHSDYSMGRSGSERDAMEFDRETAEHWVRNMRNEDKSHPMGGKWSPDMLKPLAQKYGIPTEGAKFWEFYAMTNAMYSDYGEVARKFGITSPEFYVCMAKAWMNDKDAKPDKTALYYEYIVEKE